MIEPERTVLWSADSVQPNNTSIELNDSIDNYDELIYYGSGTRTYCPCVMTYYPVVSGQLNLGGPFFYGIWTTGASYDLCNGTQMFLSGNSGFVGSSYYWGKQNNGTAYEAALVNNRTSDVRPYKIVGLKYPKNDDRTVIWSSDHADTIYNTNIQLSEPVTHFKEIAVLGSGYEANSVGCRHTSKNIYNTQPRVMGCDAWAYTPWKIAEKHNLVIGQELRLSGNSGHIGSGYFMGMGNQTTAWAAGKWNTDYQFSATAPYKIYGIDRKPVRKLTLINGGHGTVSASVLTGCEYDAVTLSNTPDEDWYFSGYNITGATLTGNKFMFTDSDVTVEAVWADTPQIKTLTLQTDGHGTLTANKVTGFEGDTVTLTPTYNDYYRFSTYQTTGGTVNGNTYTFGTAQEQTAKANFSANKFTITGNYNYGQVTYTASWDAKVRSIVGKDVPTSWGTVGNNFNPGSCSAYGFTYKTKVNGWYERGSSRLQLYHYIGSTRTKSAGVEGYNGYNNYTNSCTLTGTSTLTGHPKLSAWISCSYNKHTNGMPTNGWTATGYIK